MDMRKRQVEITLEALRLETTGRERERTSHALTALLLWPRLAIARKTAAATLDLQKGCWQARGQPWSRRILFKETVQGRFAFGFSLSDALSDAQVEAFMEALAGHWLKLAAEQVEDLAGATPAVNFASFPLGYLAKAIAGRKGTKSLVEGSLDLNAADLPEAGETLCWEMDLVAPAGIHRMVRRRTGRVSRSVPMEVLPEGGLAGQATFRVRML